MWKKTQHTQHQIIIIPREIPHHKQTNAITHQLHSHHLLMTSRSEILQFVMHDIVAHLASNNEFTDSTVFQCIDGDERKNVHIWKIEHHQEGQYWEQNNAISDIFIETVETVRQRGDFDTNKFTAISINKSPSEQLGDITTYSLRISYQRIPIVRPELPIVDGASDIVVGRYERTKKTLFSSMFEYCVTKKLDDGECCCAGCDSDRQRGDPPNSYYLCQNLHLLCFQCKRVWRGDNGQSGCPLCRNETEYQFVITPQSSQDSRDI